MSKSILSYDNLLRGNIGKWLDDYHSSLSEVISYVQSFDGLKSHLGIKKLNSAIPYLHASILLSDLTSVAVSDPKKATIKICPELVATIQIPNSVIAEQNININTNWKNVGYTQSSGKSARKFLSEIKPAIIKEKIIVRPDRIAIFKNKEGNFHMVHCEPDCSKYDWIVSKEQMINKFFPVKILSERTEEIKLALPYLKNVSTNDFLRVLEMNQDCISTIRSALREATKDIRTKSEAEFRDIRCDVIDPKLEELKRSFKRIIKSTALRIGATGVGTIAASLSAVSVDFKGMTTASILGGGLGLITMAKEYSKYTEQLEYLKDNPYYLFWKMKTT